MFYVNLCSTWMSSAAQNTRCGIFRVMDKDNRCLIDIRYVRLRKFTFHIIQENLCPYQDSKQISPGQTLLPEPAKKILLS
jgi:hypothetical protein